VLDQLDLDESLKAALVLGQEKKKNNIELETKINKLGIEINMAANELQKLKEKLAKMNDEGSSLDQLERNYLLLTQEFKLRSADLNKAKLENEQLKKEFTDNSGNIDIERQALMQQITKLERTLEEKAKQNERLTQDLQLQGEKVLEVDNVLVKGNQIKTELERMDKIVESKRATVSQAEKELASLSLTIQKKKETHAALEQRLAGLHEELKKESKPP